MLDLECHGSVFTERLIRSELLFEGETSQLRTKGLSLRKKDPFVRAFINTTTREGRLGISKNDVLSLARPCKQASTVGLVTAEEFKKARVLAETGVGDKETKGTDGGDGEAAGTNVREKRRKKRGKKKMISTLSFGEEIAEDEDGEGGKASGVAAVTEKF